MKHVNLDSLIESYENLNEDLFQNYLELFEIKFQGTEIEDLSKLLKNLKANQVHNLNNFYIGYSINQISKQFDLLRFGTNNIVNIELKRRSTPEKIEKQLIQNRYYLQFLGKPVHTFTFVSETNDLYVYDHTNTLYKTDIYYLVSILDSQMIEEIDNIDSLFKPSNYLVSPFNSTEKFLSQEYFLTDHQVNIKKEIIELFNISAPNFVSIVGRPGTGKTLLTYDIAHDYRSNGYDVLIVHCASLNSGHVTLKSRYSWDIISIKDIHQLSSFSFDILIINEAQRLFDYQLEIIRTKVNSLSANCIFSYDPDQCLSNKESYRDIGTKIENEVAIKTHRLTNKIRTNKEIASFVVSLFNLNAIKPNQTYKNIDIEFFNDFESAKSFSKNLASDGWEIINFTGSQYYTVYYDRYQSIGHNNSHKVIGQEYDKVVVFIDHHFYYDFNDKLKAENVDGGAYAIDKMLYQNLTRTREKLCIIIVKNKAMLTAILNILIPKQAIHQ